MARRRAHQPPHRGDVSRRDRRDRSARRDHREPAAPLYAQAARRRAGSRSRAPRHARAAAGRGICRARSARRTTCRRSAPGAPCRTDISFQEASLTAQRFRRLLPRPEHDAADDRARARALSRRLDRAALSRRLGERRRGRRSGTGAAKSVEALAREGDKVTFVYNATFTHPWQEELASAHPRHGARRHGWRLFRLRAARRRTNPPGSSRGNISSRAASRRSTRRSRAGRAITA